MDEQLIALDECLAGEILELGEALFDAVIEAAAQSKTTLNADDARFPEQDIRAAADAFFMALRQLLGSRGLHQ